MTVDETGGRAATAGTSDPITEILERGRKDVARRAATAGTSEPHPECKCLWCEAYRTYLRTGSYREVIA